MRGDAATQLAGGLLMVSVLMALLWPEAPPDPLVKVGVCGGSSSAKRGSPAGDTL